ncbi:MAG: polysaccharide deacetylase family protein [Clostridiales bacterium]|jgi:polysaccharide deacetylase family sporulation protein PdaB|nr:polysaccharide deacetylase family protein [Clostridiales bacterium]
MFITVNAKKVLRIFLSAVAAAAALSALSRPALSSAYLGYSLRRLPIYSVETPDKRISITFDAAWGADKTARIIDVLNANGIKATFFLVGFWIERYPDEVKALDAAGMELGNHTENHPDMARLTAAQMADQLASVNRRLKEATDKEVTLFRPPFGSYCDKLIETSAGLGLRVIQWDVDSLDWKDSKTSSIVERVTKKVKNGSIILFHNNSDAVVDAIGIIIPTLKNQGYEFVTVGKLVHDGDYYIDHTGRQIKK